MDDLRKYAYDPAIQLVVGSVLLVLLYWIIKTCCCPFLCQRTTPTPAYDIPDDDTVDVEPKCHCTGPISGVVARVSDGDGFWFLHSCPDLSQFYTIRLAGIDAPEMGKDSDPGQPFAPEAKEYLKNLVHRKWVNLEKLRIDQYGRFLAIAYLLEPTPLNVNLEMVRQGLACVYRGRDAVYGDFYQEFCYLEEQAIKDKVGMWSIPNVQTPMDWKRQQRVLKFTRPQHPIHVV